MTIYLSFNSNQWLKNLSNIFQQFNEKRSMSYGDVKKIFNVFIDDTRWIHEPRLVRCKYALYLKLDDLIQKHKNKNVNKIEFSFNTEALTKSGADGSPQPIPLSLLS